MGFFKNLLKRFENTHEEELDRKFQEGYIAAKKELEAKKAAEAKKELEAKKVAEAKKELEAKKAAEAKKDLEIKEE